MKIYDFYDLEGLFCKLISILSYLLTQTSELRFWREMGFFEMIMRCLD